MYWLKKVFAVSVVVVGLASCSKKDKNQEVVFIEPALLDTIFSNSYEGIIPCPDCPGIETTVRIYSDSTISRTVYYQEKSTLPTTKIGTWTLEDSVFHATFDREKLFFKIKDADKILRVGSDFKEVSGDLAANYVLHKAPLFSPQMIEGLYYSGDTLNIFNQIQVKHLKKDAYNVSIAHINKSDSLCNCDSKWKAILDKDHQLNIDLNKEKEPLKIIFTKQEAHVLFDNHRRDSISFQCVDSLRKLPVVGAYKKIQE